MSENIPYIIAENGYYYVAYKEKAPVPEIVVSSKGVVNGLSEEYNDGWDFGPDSYSPTSTSAIPYTQTYGVNEALDYAQSNLEMYFPPQFSSPVRPIYYNVKKVKLMPGLFKITAPITMQFFDGYENDTTTNQSFDFPIAYANDPVIIIGNSTLPALSASTTALTITAPDATTTYTGYAVIAGQ